MKKKTKNEVEVCVGMEQFFWEGEVLPYRPVFSALIANETPYILEMVVTMVPQFLKAHALWFFLLNRKV